MSYTALYRKYRPALFAHLLGQEHIVKTLKNQITGGKVSHAYLFCGTRGTGKTSVAKIFAKAINCLSPQDGEPCGACRLCVEIKSGRGFNVLEIDAASNNGVDNIREIREEVKYTPTEGVYKVYIIDEAHMLTGGAFNALLKTLEEPPPHVIFILATTDPGRIPVTIHSRCQRYDFRRIGGRLIAEKIAEYLEIEGISAKKDALTYIAKLADGSMRDALSIMDRCISFYEGEEITADKVREVTGGIDPDSFFIFAECLNDMDSGGALLKVSEIMEQGKDAGQFITEALSHFRSILISKTVNNCSVVLDISEDSADELNSFSEKMDSVRIMTYINSFSELISQVRYSSNPRLLLEIEIIKLCNPAIINNSYEEIYNKVLKLEKDLKDRPQVVNIGMPQDNVQNEQTALKKAESNVTVKKILLPEDFMVIKEHYSKIRRKIAEKSIPFAGVLEDTRIEFLDDKFLYVVFTDEANEQVLKNYPEKQELFTEAVAEVTGKNCEIKTITEREYEARALGITVETNSSSKSEALAKAVMGEINGVDVLISD